MARIENGEIYGQSTIEDPDGVMATSAPIGDPDPTRPWRAIVAEFAILGICLGFVLGAAFGFALGRWG